MNPVPEENKPASDSLAVQNYIVGLIDILNQRSELAKWDVLNNPNVTLDTIRPHLKSTIGTVAQLRQMGTNFIESFSSAEKLPPIGNREIDDTIESLTAIDLHTQSFSDTIVYYAPINSPSGLINVRSIAGVFLGMASLHLTALAGKVATRGSIEVGAGCNALPGQIYGPCLAKAHHLESEVSDYPRIVVGDSATKMIDAGAQSSPSSFSEQAIQAIFSDLLGLIFIDTDGVKSLDFAGCFVSQLDGENALLASAYQNATSFAISCHQEFQNTNNKLRDRYNHLATYLQSRAHAWAGS